MRTLKAAGFSVTTIVFAFFRRLL